MPLATRRKFLRSCKRCAAKEPEMYVALTLTSRFRIGEIVRILNIANENHFRMVLATRRPDKQN